MSSVDPAVHLAVIGLTREEVARVIGPVMDQLKTTLGNIEGKLERIESAERESDRHRIQTDGKVSGLCENFEQNKNDIVALRADVKELKSIVDTVDKAQVGISAKVAIAGAVIMLIVNAIAAAVISAGVTGIGAM
jgi:hypothetical protein